MYIYTSIFVNPEDRIELFYLPFEFDEDQIYYEKNNIDRVDCAIRDIVWHMENNLWEHSRAYYEGTGVEKLSL